MQKAVRHPGEAVQFELAKARREIREKLQQVDVCGVREREAERATEGEDFEVSCERTQTAQARRGHKRRNLFKTDALRISGGMALSQRARFVFGVLFLSSSTVTLVSRSLLHAVNEAS